METEERLRIDRDAYGLECQCGGYAKRVGCTSEEKIKYGCRCSWGSECCSRAFVCRVCGVRIVGQAIAPNMDDFYLNRET